MTKLNRLICLKLRLLVKLTTVDSIDAGASQIVIENMPQLKQPTNIIFVGAFLPAIVKLLKTSLAPFLLMMIALWSKPI